MYADDLPLISDSPEGLQHMLDIVSSYAHSWRYAINAQKCAILFLDESPALDSSSAPPVLGIYIITSYLNLILTTILGFYVLSILQQ